MSYIRLIGLVSLLVGIATAIGKLPVVGPNPTLPGIVSQCGELAKDFDLSKVSFSLKSKFGDYAATRSVLAIIMGDPASKLFLGRINTSGGQFQQTGVDSFQFTNVPMDYGDSLVGFVTGYKYDVATNCGRYQTRYLAKNLKLVDTALGGADLEFEVDNMMVLTQENEQAFVHGVQSNCRLSKQPKGLSGEVIQALQRTVCLYVVPRLLEQRWDVSACLAESLAKKLDLERCRQTPLPEFPAQVSGGETPIKRNF